MFFGPLPACNGCKVDHFFCRFIVLFYLFVFGRLSSIVQKPLVWLGTISYSLYLTHTKIGFIILQHSDVYHYLGYLRFDPYFNVPITLVCALLLASLLTYLIEKPAMNFIRNVYRREQLPK